MNIKDIYEKFDRIGVLTFTTINQDMIPISRVAHLRGFDDKGIYFSTMITKSFYDDLKLNKKISICGLCASSEVNHDEDGLPTFEPGYSIRLSGDVEEVSMDEIKSKNNPIFDICIKDHEKYKAITTFCIISGFGEVFNYDFEMNTMDHKIQRDYFSFNGEEIREKGLQINKDMCISCGICLKVCSFKAVELSDNNYEINSNRCDECGDCFINCPSKAISKRSK